MKKNFSERLGIVDVMPMLQTDSMNDALRNSIWNILYSLFQNNHDYWTPLAKSTANHFRKVPVDEVPYDNYDCQEWIKAYFFSFSWNKTYEFVEFVVNNYEKILRYPNHRRKELEGIFNVIFEREMSGFRFVAGELAPISNPTETQEISNAIEMTSHIGLNGAHHHLKSALALLAKKPTPDYLNSIKESISAVESIAKILGKENSQGLTDALAELAKKTSIHGGLQAGFNKLYGYTSNENGIRHAILDEPNVGFDEAKYMVVSCSAFVNYLIAKADAAGLLKKAQ